MALYVGLKRMQRQDFVKANPIQDSIAWSFIPRGNDTHFTVVLLERFGILAEYPSETAAEEPPLVATQAEEKEEEEDPEEHPPTYSPLPPFPPSPELGPGEYDDPHYWNFDGDLD
ncbi:hypothetical protein PIB30_020382 [Stylosanthes scabra]|uniref:Uncharacterized protein n=1 Tax=Stylosanthes scabra TaxID=79078 RepID=A0ABU6Q8E2_9FABA|nr:hypothetical protein [Stylosanthes scabra]